MPRTVARLLAESLEAHDIDLIYCVPGESYLGLTDALADMNRVRLIVCRHESGAGFMAVADGRMRDRAGVCVVSRGPGISNAMIALHSAYHDATPLVVLVGQVERRDFGRLALQEQNYSRLLADVTKAVIEVNEPIMASEALARAFHLAESGTRGPVAVILPEDLFEEPADDIAVDPPRPRALPGARAEDVERLAAMLTESERPLVWVGAALLGDGVSNDLGNLAEQWMLPVSPTHRWPHLFSSNHPHYGGYVGIRVPEELMNEMQRADLLVALGERLSDTVSQSYRFPTAPQPQLKLVHVWPDANEVGRVWRPDLGIAGDPQSVIHALLTRGAPGNVERRRAWVSGLNTIHRRMMQVAWEPASDGVNFSAVTTEVAKHLASDAAITSDAGNFATFIHRHIGLHPGQMFLASVVGAMGSGIPMAVAAGLRRPGKQAVAFVGDGGALMTGNELATARLYGVNPILIIADNRCYGTIAMHHIMRFPGRPYRAATELMNPDFAVWANAFGAEGISIRTEAEVAPAIARAFAVKHRPVVVHVHASAEQMTAYRRRN
jgi:acetolactate synthase-1/2/3 large subunit